jgi:hypothetical protein
MSFALEGRLLSRASQTESRSTKLRPKSVSWARWGDAGGRGRRREYGPGSARLGQCTVANLGSQCHWSCSSRAQSGVVVAMPPTTAATVVSVETVEAQTLATTAAWAPVPRVWYAGVRRLAVQRETTVWPVPALQHAPLRAACTALALAARLARFASLPPARRPTVPAKIPSTAPPPSSVSRHWASVCRSRREARHARSTPPLLRLRQP